MTHPSGRAPGLLIGAALSSTVVLVAMTALAWTPYDPEKLDVPAKLQTPSWAHWFGTDQLGRDVLSMIMAGAHSSLIVACVAVLMGASLGVPLGLWAGSRGGLVDEVIMRVNDLVFAFPALLLAILIAAIWGPSARTAVIAIGAFNVPVFARVTRASALTLWRRDYITAARVAGKSVRAISLEHVLPNLTSVLIVQATIQFSLCILAEAGLSYVGLGVQPPTPSWGRMLNEAQTLTALAPTLAIFPGVALALTVLGLNLLGDGLRDRWGRR